MHTGWSVMLQCARMVQPLPGCGSDLCPLDMSRGTQLKNIGWSVAQHHWRRAQPAAHPLAILALLELHNPLGQGEQGVVLAQGSAHSCVELRAGRTTQVSERTTAYWQR